MKLEVWVATWRVRSEESKVIEIPDEELEGLTEDERLDLFADYAYDEIESMIEWGWREVE